MSKRELQQGFRGSFFSMKHLLFVVTIIQGNFAPSCAVTSGLMWSKSQRNFVPILTDPRFRAIHRQAVIKSKQEEILNLQGRTVKFTFYQEDNVVEFLNNDRTVSGITGDIWTTLSNALNFTLQPVRSDLNSIGISYPNQTFSALLHVIHQNRTDVLAAIEAYAVRLGALDFTVPLWRSRFRLYVQPVKKYDRTWMVKIFSWKIWCATFTMHFALMACGYVTQKILSRLSQDGQADDLCEHFFYNFAMMCNQSYMPHGFHCRSRILEISLSLFSSIMNITYSTLLITYLTKKVFIPPFEDITSMMKDTKYDLVAVEGSLLDLTYKNRHRYQTGKEITVGRYITVPTIDDMYAKCCSPSKKYVMLEEENLKKSRFKYTCQLNPIGKSYFNTWIVSGVAKGFKQKRAIDIGILKMHEFGIIRALKSRWLESQHDEEISDRTLEAINMEQVSVIVGMFCSGTLFAISLLILENAVSRWFWTLQ